eukprot:scaffold8626_cov87-Cyclotella_meneghiniana.AAC.6
MKILAKSSGKAVPGDTMSLATSPVSTLAYLPTELKTQPLSPFPFSIKAGELHFDVLQMDWTLT